MTTTPEEPADAQETGLPTAPDEVEDADEGTDEDTPPVAPINSTNG